GDTFDVGRRNKIQVFGIERNVVDQDKGLAAIDRVYSANVDLGRASGFAAQEIDVKVRYSSLKTLRHTLDRPCFQDLVVDRVHGTGKVGFLLRAVAHYNNFFQRRRTDA